jgi:hypothetical protein
MIIALTFVVFFSSPLFFFRHKFLSVRRVFVFGLDNFFFLSVFVRYLPVYVYLKKEKNEIQPKNIYLYGKQYINRICRYNMIVHLGYILLFSSVFVQGDQDESAKTHVGKCEEYQRKNYFFLV